MAVKTVFQCDFDGTITPEDVSFMILDAFGKRDWRQILAQYKEGKITIAQFNRRAFTAVKADEETLVRFVKERARVRPGFRDLISYCRQRGFRFVVVSNGLDFYIKTVLSCLDACDIEVFAARTGFGSDGIEAQYLGPSGEPLEDRFKESYLRSFQESGCRVIYAGNGFSDIAPASKAYHVFATGELLSACKEKSINCTPFNDLKEIVTGLESLT
ncbi:MAG: MtnX-like HAD-IB family phosphatase [Dehalococcoidales bacterium]|nr:MtnX-like HAD-IB family phosphatase [Dehalococcoidales bacterium]